jgi:hypothetical protein
MTSIFNEVWVGLAVTHLDEDVWIPSKWEIRYFNSKGFIGSLTPANALAGEEVFIYLPSSDYFGIGDEFCHPSSQRIFERICQIIVDRLVDS